jgi:hypothetical protein
LVFSGSAQKNNRLEQRGGWHGWCLDGCLLALGNRSIMKPLTKTMKRMLDSLACADAGERLSQREKTHLLSDPGTLARRNRGVSDAARRVAVAAADSPSLPAMRYAIESCQQLGAGLDLLVSPRCAPKAESVAAQLGSERIDVRTVPLEGHLMDALADYLRHNPGVSFLITDPGVEPLHALVSGRRIQSNLWRPQVPVVVVTAGE